VGRQDKAKRKRLRVLFSFLKKNKNFFKKLLTTRPGCGII
jgi:hypothetical protein